MCELSPQSVTRGERYTESLSEEAVRRRSSKQVLLKISQYLQENTCAAMSF